MKEQIDRAARAYIDGYTDLTFDILRTVVGNARADLELMAEEHMLMVCKKMLLDSGRERAMVISRADKAKFDEARARLEALGIHYEAATTGGEQ